MLATLRTQIVAGAIFGILATVVMPCAHGAGVYTPVDISPHFNWRVQEFPFGAAPTFPDGPVVFDSVPFSRPASGNNAWRGWFEIAGSLEGQRMIDIPVGKYGVQDVFTLINTMAGEELPGTFAHLEFYGSGGAFYQHNLDGNSDIRDYLYGEWTNTINGTSTVNGFIASPGIYGQEVRLDMQVVSLPTAFETQTLQMIRVVDDGGTIPSVLAQRLVLSGITVHSVPEPSTLAMAGFGVLGQAIARALRNRSINRPPQ